MRDIYTSQPIPFAVLGICWYSNRSSTCSNLVWSLEIGNMTVELHETAKMAYQLGQRQGGASVRCLVQAVIAALLLLSGAFWFGMLVWVTAVLFGRHALRLSQQAKEACDGSTR